MTQTKGPKVCLRVGDATCVILRQILPIQLKGPNFQAFCYCCECVSIASLTPSLIFAGGIRIGKVGQGEIFAKTIKDLKISYGRLETLLIPQRVFTLYFILVINSTLSCKRLLDIFCTIQKINKSFHKKRKLNLCQF